MRFDLYVDEAAEIKQKYERELAGIDGKSKDLRPEAVERMRQEARQRYDQAVAALQDEARRHIADQRAALAVKRKEAQRQSFARLRETVGDVVAAGIVRDRLEGLDAEGLVGAYQDAADDFERLLTAHHGARLLKDDPHNRARFLEVVGKDDPARAVDNELSGLAQMEADLPQLDELAHIEGIRARFGI